MHSDLTILRVLSSRMLLENASWVLNFLLIGSSESLDQIAVLDNSLHPQLPP